MGRAGVPGLDASAAESLLRGDLRHAGAPDVLVHLLTAATAPARPHELDGEETAVAAFRRPDLTPVHPARRRALITRLLTVKVTAAFALTAAGGVALAAVDALPGIPGVSGLGPRSTGVTSGSGLAPGAVAPGAGHRSASPRTTSTPLPSTLPSPESLCLLLLSDRRNGPAGGAQSPGLDSRTLAALIALAGGEPAKVWPYCSHLLGIPVHAPSEQPSPASPTAPPTAAPGSGRPSSQASPSTAPSSTPAPQPSPGPGSSQPDPNSADRSPSSTPSSRSATVSSSRGGHR